MEQEKILTEGQLSQPKKAYTKPVLSLVNLVAEEAVLSLCKDAGASGGGWADTCLPDSTCTLSTARS